MEPFTARMHGVTLGAPFTFVLPVVPRVIPFSLSLSVFPSISVVASCWAGCLI